MVTPVISRSGFQLKPLVLVEMLSIVVCTLCLSVALALFLNTSLSFHSDPGDAYRLYVSAQSAYLHCQTTN